MLRPTLPGQCRLVLESSESILIGLAETYGDRLVNEGGSVIFSVVWVLQLLWWMQSRWAIGGYSKRILRLRSRACLTSLGCKISSLAASWEITVVLLREQSQFCRSDSVLQRCFVTSFYAFAIRSLHCINLSRLSILCMPRNCIQLTTCTIDHRK